MKFHSLLPLLDFLGDFGSILVDDDKQDIGMLNRPHHYQFGIVMKGAAETAKRLVEFSERMMLEQQGNGDKNMIIISQRSTGNNDPQLEAQRRELLKQYLGMVKPDSRFGPGGYTNIGGPIYMGNIDQLKKKKNQKALPVKPLPLPPKIKL